MWLEMVQKSKYLQGTGHHTNVEKWTIQDGLLDPDYRKGS
jgi:hypothetical protein